MVELERLTISKALHIAEELTRRERETPSLIDADSPERNTSWGSVLEGLRIMKEHGVPDSMRDED